MCCIAYVHCYSIWRPSGIKCIIYAFLVFVALRIQDEWRGRWNTLLWLPGVKGSEMKNLPRLPRFPSQAQTHTHRNTHVRKCRQAPPLHVSSIPCHLWAYLKVTCRRRWMCGLQPLKCPHEAKELFVSLEELQSPGWDRNRRLTPLSCFHHNRMTLCHRWEGTQLPYEIHSAHEGKGTVRQLDGYFSWQALIQKKSLRAHRLSQSEKWIWFSSICCGLQDQVLLNTVPNIYQDRSHSLLGIGK